MGLGILGAVGGLLGGMGERREAKSASKQSKKNTQAALGELTPEAMQAMIQKFYTQYMAQMNPQMQAAFSHIANNLARRGMTGMGVAQQLKAGIPGQFSLGAMNQAIGSAMPIAKQRASIRADQPVITPKSWLGIGGDFVNGFIGGGGIGPGMGMWGS